MSLIFLAYANNKADPLPTLSEEDTQVYRLLTPRYKKGHYKIHRESNTTLAKIAEQLIAFRDELTVFSFSGHAGRDRLLMEDKAANATGIAKLLGACPNLKLVILNGCSTAMQVNELLQLESAPVVIATSAPVNDYAAAQFGSSFFQCFCEQYSTIADAFQIGLAAAQVATSNSIDIQKTRDLVGEPTGGDNPVWGIYTPEGHQIKLEWNIPATLPSETINSYQANAILLDQLMEWFAPFQDNINQLHSQEMEGFEVSILKKRRAILEILPHPISEHLRKLLVEREETSAQTFFDRIGIHRLHQLTATYKSVIELPAFILLAQLWDAMVRKESKVELVEAQSELLKQYLNVRTNERIQGIYFQLIPILLEIFEQNEVPLFVEEFNAIKEDFIPGSDFYNSCLFFENMDKRKQVAEAEAAQFCIEGEEKLATILGKLGFLTRYTLISVKNVRVKKNRYQLSPKFQHRLVELIQRFVGLEPTQYLADKIIDDSSIHLQKTNGGEKSFLNLSPFIIDEHAFDDSAQVAKIYYFDSYQKGVDVCCFRHIYKPKDNLLLLKANMRPKKDKNWQLRVFRKQFDVFSNLLFDQALNQL